MRKILAAAVVGSVMLAGGLGAGVGAVGATAMRDGGGPFKMLLSGQIGRLLMLRSELNLTADQRTQIRTILQSHRAEIAKAVAPLVADRRALRDLTTADTTDEKAIRAASTKLADDIGDAAILAAKVKGEVRKIITPDQLQKIQDFRKQSDGAVDRFIEDMGKPV